MFRYTDKRTGTVLEFQDAQPAFAHDWWDVEEVDGEPAAEPTTAAPPSDTGAEDEGGGGGGEKPPAPDPLPAGYKTLKRPQLEKLAAKLGIEDAKKIPNAPGLVDAIETKHAELVAAAA